MAKNVKTYVLLGAVIVIWGIIAIRIFSALSPEPEEQKIVSNATFTRLKPKHQDTFTIKADYRDPFLGTTRKPSTQAKKPKKVIKKEMPPLNIQYTGSMLNSSNNKRIFFVTLNGQQHLLETGKTAQEVTLVRGSEKTITIRYQGFTKSIPLQQ